MIRTIQVEFHQSPAISQAIYLANCQQRLAYNEAMRQCIAADKALPLLKSARNPNGLYGQLTAWRRNDSRFVGHVNIHRAGVSAARDAFIKFKKSNFKKRQQCLQWEPAMAAGKDKPRPLNHHRDPESLLRSKRSALRGGISVCSLVPPRLANGFELKLPGIGLIELKLGPDQMSGLCEDGIMRSFQLVETTQSRTRCTGIDQRTYKLHLQIRIANPGEPYNPAFRGIDMGIAHTLTLASDAGEQVEFHDPPADCLRSKGDRIARLQAERKNRRYRSRRCPHALRYRWPMPAAVIAQRGRRDWLASHSGPHQRRVGDLSWIYLDLKTRRDGSGLHHSPGNQLGSCDGRGNE